MDLRTWMTEELSGVQLRVHSSIAAHIPHDRWHERPGHAGREANSVASALFHMTLHHDLAITTVVRNQPPLVEQWRNALGISGWSPSTGLSEAENARFTSGLDPVALIGYHDAVWAASETWLSRVAMTALDVVPQTAFRLTKVGVTDDEVPWLHRMWVGKPISWFAQWPMIGHPLSHLGELTATRSQLGLSPF